MAVVENCVAGRSWGRPNTCRPNFWRFRRLAIASLLFAPNLIAGGAGAADVLALKPTTGWQAYGEGYDDPGAIKQGNIVTLTGLLRHKSGQWGHVTILPSGYRPPKQLVFNVNHHQDSTRLDVLPNGQIRWVAGGKKHGWIGLNGISFAVRAGNAPGDAARARFKLVHRDVKKWAETATVSNGQTVKIAHMQSGNCDDDACSLHPEGQ